MRALKNLAGPAIALGVAVALWFLFWILLPSVGFGDFLKTSLSRGVQGGAPFFLAFGASILTIALLCGAWVFTLEAFSNEGNARRTLGVVAVVLVLTGFGSIFWTVQVSRAAHRSEYDALVAMRENLTVTASQRPGFDLRLNIPQARNVIKQANVVGTISEPTNVGTETCALVKRDGSWMHSWYTEVVCISNAKPDDPARRASFREHVPVAGGTLGSNLGAYITQNFDQGLVFEHDDVYGYIDENNKPHVVVPVVRKQGWKAPHDLPAGVVTFDRDANAKWIKDIRPGQIPGPVVPMSIAASVRKAVNSTNGFVKFSRPTRNEDSLQTTDRAGKLTAADPNTENVSEFVLTSKGRTYFVTPMTAYGSSTAIAAYLVVRADEVRYLETPKATLYRLDAVEPGPQTIATRITGLYSGLQWAGGNSGSSGNVRRIYEVTPAAAGQVAVTVGVGTDMQYRVLVSTDTGSGSKVGELCLYSAKANVLIRCDGPDVTSAAVTDTAAPAKGGTKTGTDLTDVPTDQLIAELARRFPAGTATPSAS